MPLRLPDFLQPALARPVAILGGGVSGQGLQALLAELGAVGTVYDANPANGAVFTAAAARQHALVIFSPGFPPDHPWLKRGQAAGADCWGELDFASLCWRGQLVAITGTNGKTTLTELLTHALRSGGREAHATGNIGQSFSRLVAVCAGGNRGVYAVCEVSSFHAETLRQFRPDAVLWTNFAEDHLERHRGLESYFAAKWKLAATAPVGAVFIGSSVQRFAQKFDRPASRMVSVPTEGQPGDARLERTIFSRYPQRENFLLAAAWWRANGFEDDALYAAARTLPPRRHRLARVAECDGVTFWNDSKATNFHAVEAALAGFSAPVVLIAGGRSKGGDLAGFVHRIAPRVKHAVLIGETSAELSFHCAASRVAHSSCATFAESIHRATEVADDGDHILLSPGFASFDQFRNYEDRGDQFEALVENLGAASARPGGPFPPSQPSPSIQHILL